MKNKDFFEDKVSFIVGKGDRVSFWEDRWCLRDSLKTRFPRLYAVSRAQNQTVQQIFGGNGEYGFSLQPGRRLTDQEISEFVELCKLLENFILTEEEDERQWADGKSPFAAKVVMGNLEDIRRNQKGLGILNFPTDRLWKTKFVPPKVAFFGWTVIRGRILTVDKLQKRGMSIVNRCAFCKQAEESAHHLFVGCHESKAIWQYFWSFSENGSLDDEDLRGRLLQEGDQRLSKVGKLYWNMVFHAILWGLWMERNRRCFEGRERKSWQILCDIKELIWDWGLADNYGKEIRVEEVMTNWDAIMYS